MNKKSNPYQNHQCDIYSNPKQYDAINSFEHDIPFYIGKAKKSGKKVLELACGTGRVAIPMAKAGLEVTGIDLSPIMLDYGRKKATDAGVNINFIEGDMTNFNLNETFETVMCIHNSLGHIYDLPTIQNFFDCIKKHLTANGIFILQTFTPDPYFFVRDKDEKLPFTKYTDPDTGAEVEITESSYYDDELQIHQMTWYFNQEGKKELQQEFTARVFYPQELDNMLQLLGFKILAKYGDYDETSFSEYPDTQIFICQLA